MFLIKTRIRYFSFFPISTTFDTNSTEIAAILKRRRQYIQEKYLRPMIRGGELLYAYPDNPAHPHQAYKAVSKSKKK